MKQISRRAFAGMFAGIATAIPYLAGTPSKHTPSFTQGLPLVPDGMTALLHKGESIIPAAQFKKMAVAEFERALKFNVGGLADQASIHMRRPGIK
jgi:hypothetical protein